MIKKFGIEIASVGILIVLFGLVGNSITGNVVKTEEKPEKVVMYIPLTTDVGSTEQGTLTFDFALPPGFKVGNKSVDVIMFIDSVNMPGLKVGYDVNAKKISAGMPLLTTSEVTIFDSQRHKLAYTFQRESRKQAIILDDKILAEGEFTGIADSNAITGFAVFQKWAKVESPIEIKSSFE